MHPSIVKDVIEGVRAAGGTAIQNLEDDTLTINDEITASIVIARCKLTRGGLRRWKIRLDETLRPDLTICVRMDEDNMTAHDYLYLAAHDPCRRRAAARRPQRSVARRIPLVSLDGFFTLGGARAVSAGGVTMARPAQRVEMIPIDRITIVNPRLRSKRYSQGHRREYRRNRP
jgi:hypothetical protein